MLCLKNESDSLLKANELKYFAKKQLDQQSESINVSKVELLTKPIYINGEDCRQQKDLKYPERRQIVMDNLK